ncbi:MAG: cupin domain-containing protein [Actinomycetota bacterium]|nr:cupin domain-containing protein [Actinomycetota bacterium]
MGGSITRSEAGRDVNAADLEQRFRSVGLTPRTFANAPGDTYGAHSHTTHKILFCAEGSITFHTDDGDLEMHAGDRLDLEPDTQHRATVGPDGVVCVEAHADGPDALPS